jgi:hypothetical protein
VYYAVLRFLYYTVAITIGGTQQKVKGRVVFLKNAVFWDVAAAERRFTQELHAATSQKTAFFIVTAVKTLDLTAVFLFHVGQM